MVAQSDQNAAFIKERYEAEKALEQCKERLAQMTIQDSKLSDEINTLKNQLRFTRENIKDL